MKHRFFILTLTLLFWNIQEVRGVEGVTDARGQATFNTYLMGNRLASTLYKNYFGATVSSTFYTYDPQLKYQLNDISDLPPATGTPQLYSLRQKYRRHLIDGARG